MVNIATAAMAIKIQDRGQLKVGQVIHSADVWIDATIHRDVSLSTDIITHIKLGTTGILRRVWLLENIALAMAIVIETTQREVCSASVRAQYSGQHIRNISSTIQWVVREVRHSNSLSTSVFMVSIFLFVIISFTFNFIVSVLSS